MLFANWKGMEMFPEKAARFKGIRAGASSSFFTAVLGPLVSYTSARGAVHPRLSGHSLYLRHPVKGDFAQWGQSAYKQCRVSQALGAGLAAG